MDKNIIRFELSLFNMAGNLITTKEFKAEIMLDIKSLIKGAYLLFFTDGVKHATKYFHI